MTSPETRKIVGKPISFGVLDQGRTLIRLSDGNYLQIIVVVNKVLKTDQMTPDGFPVYNINTNLSISIWSAEEIKQLKEDQL